MCGRYVTPDQRAAEAYFSLVKPWWEYQPSFNFAPTQAAPVVLSVDGERHGQLMRWGMVPFQAHGVAPKKPWINATLENLEQSFPWRSPWSRGQRCILPAQGFYEWHQFSDGRKEPFYIHLADRDMFGFAGVWERSSRPDGSEVLSCALITMPANELLDDIHNAGAHPGRMPAILAEEKHDAWLQVSAKDAKAVLTPYPSDLMVAFQVSRKVNSPRNDDASLIEPQAG